MQPSTLGRGTPRDLTRAKGPLQVVVLGAGKIGRTIAVMLHDSGDYRVSLVDNDARRSTACRAPSPCARGTRPSRALAPHCWPVPMPCSMRCRSTPR